MAEEDSPVRPHPAAVLPGVSKRGRITLLRKLFLRRQGRTDGRLRKPDPLLTPVRQVTPMRRRLLVELQQGLSVVTARHAQRVRSLQEGNRQASARTKVLTRELVTAQQSVTSTVAKAPDPTVTPKFRPGDRKHSEELVRARRLREHERDVARARTNHNNVEQALNASKAAQADLRTRIEHLRTEAAAEAEEMRALVMAQQAVYDAALLRTHTDAELLRRLLETSEPDLDAWLDSLSPEADDEEAS